MNKGGKCYTKDVEDLKSNIPCYRMAVTRRIILFKFEEKIYLKNSHLI